ncbi:hypothetical protein Tel_00510 [Candidatus Tenderia electrophaga]|jgi:hypothetical protein|uniref:Uncharacterized protein n=1 Tax=Candidatus Tenderia electrophaga TaxID=1748243 RepID=A0A0S2T9D4_9GAMM|nr:hypothetical protein Tel_00510 [Candidatus Tenderia electrophaga]
MRSLIVVLIMLLLSACSEPDPRFLMVPQQWNDTVVQIESRPTPIRPGMNEFLIMATTERGRPVPDLVVSLRAATDDEWQQAIQDGHSGVYRRALRVPPGAPSVLVQLRKTHSDEEAVLEFPIVYADELKS